MNRLESERLRQRAHAVVSRAKKVGLLPKLDGLIKCTDCDVPATEYDHRDYFSPLMVVPVCHKCNIKRGPAFPFTVEPPTDERGEAKLNWEYDGIVQRLVECSCSGRYQRARELADRIEEGMFL